MKTLFHQLFNQLKRKITFLHMTLALVFLLQTAVLARVTKPAVGDYQVFHQIQGVRAAATTPTVDPEETKEKIALFTANLIRSGFDWQPGQSVTEESISYPLNFHSASFYFDMGTDLRQKWLLSRAVAYQKAGFSFEKFLTGDYLSKVELSGQPIIKQVSGQRWSVEVRAVRVVIASGQQAKGAAFKEKLGFKFEIEEVQPRHGQRWGMERTALNQVLNKVQKDGLRIVNYQDLV